MVLTCVSCKQVVHHGCSGIPEYQLPFFEDEFNEFTCCTCVANDYVLCEPDPFEERKSKTEADRKYIEIVKSLEQLKQDNKKYKENIILRKRLSSQIKKIIKLPKKTI